MLYLKYAFHKIIHWEYWPQWLVYAPIIPVYIYYALKSKCLHFHITANPCIQNGGYIMESKFTLYKAFPKNSQPITIAVAPTTHSTAILRELEAEGIHFPCIAKPNIGGKGMAVKIMHSIQDVLNYQQQMPIDFLLQEKIQYKKEVGIFYCRYPNNAMGFISGIVEKQPITILGNGVQTVAQLVHSQARYYYQKKYLQQAHASIWQQVLPANTQLQLSSIGNHARGSMFLNATHKSNPQLLQFIHTLSTGSTALYFGRYDIMFNDWTDLYQGKNYSLIEVNGSGSEPTHMYDPHNNIFAAWKIIMEHWGYLYEIAKQHHSNGIAYTPYSTVKQWQQAYKQIEKKIKHIV